MWKPLTALSLAVAAAGCMSYMDDEDARADMRSPRAEAQLASALRGKVVAGPPQSCIMGRDADRMNVIDDRTILFRVSSNLTYRNDLIGSCPTRGTSRRFERKSISTNLCRGEQMNVLDNQTSAYFGTCVLGDFVPYRDG